MDEWANDNGLERRSVWVVNEKGEFSSLDNVDIILLNSDYEN
jgi:hypothetical protein